MEVGSNYTIIEAHNPSPVDEVPMPTKKVILGAGMLIATFIFGVIPIKFRNVSNTHLRQALPFLSCFSGGVFMGACLLDLFPDVEESISHILKEIEKSYGWTINYPVAESIIIFGFLLTLLCEQLVLSHQEKQARQSRPVHQHRDDQIDENAPLLTGSNHSRSYSSNSPALSINQPDEPEDGDGHGHSHTVAMDNSTFRSILLTVALCFHSLFEGLAIGLQSEADALYSLFFAVIVHKSVMAFSLGMTIAQSLMSTKSLLISVSVFTVASPIGISIGIIISSLEKSLGRDVTDGVLQGIAGGTFLYITFFEVLPHEFNKPGNRLWKVFSVFVGVLAIGSLISVTG
ncbi:hypothetical protein TCAL_07353 [Tigriopus californicus]|uniref:Zinc transporter ZIP1 n=1 Tax=Tigriopus californicus TaxID=6832 RepID=A0A553NXH1_TIGCA|nr:zinc transporter ZIP1-like [Tigriopus californicus]TRY70133.1 hypothetical protein TCAL_07353 [Tigriopus californicus]|eukprot:TCALIF_07353-PA protein Name:"Similar to slc39a1 Zinc transporter ZIP1 (Danio rerio)" AED:0.03 eAED:0.03 QI:0/-1/0/1/-1/1/1/0/344